MVKILVIEDNYETWVLLQTIFEKLGMMARYASDGEEGLDEVYNWKPDVVVLDYMLAGAMNGLTIALKLRSDPHTRDLPLIAFSAMSQSSEEARQFRNVCDANINKPFTAHTWNETILRLFSKGKL